jgi:hypothetical protein
MLSWFRCTHKKTSLPVTRPREEPQLKRLNNTYVICLSCGERLPYSFQESSKVPERRKAQADGEPEAVASPGASNRHRDFARER